MGVVRSFAKVKVIKVRGEGVKILEKLRSHQRANGHKASSSGKIQYLTYDVL